MMPQTYQLQIGKITSLARRIDSTSARQSLDDERATAHSEILRSGWLKSVLKAFKDLAAKEDVSLDNITSPNLFLALERTSSTSSVISGGIMVYVCQPFVSPDDITEMVSPITAALSHFSLIHSNEERVLVGFKGVETIYGDHNIFAPVLHSISANSGLGDLGIAGIEGAKASHQCSRICKDLKFPLLGPSISSV
ncbi:hypothetical protein B0H34DRAFT_721678, partial [Crassisporium funariophilum]